MVQAFPHHAEHPCSIYNILQYLKPISGSLLLKVKFICHIRHFLQFIFMLSYVHFWKCRLYQLQYLNAMHWSCANFDVFLFLVPLPRMAINDTGETRLNIIDILRGNYSVCWTPTPKTSPFCCLPINSLVSNMAADESFLAPFTLITIWREIWLHLVEIVQRVRQNHVNKYRCLKAMPLASEARGGKEVGWGASQ